MKIEKIIKLKNDKYKIIIDGENIITYDNVILSNNLLYKKEINKDEYKKIINDTNYFDIYNKTLKYVLKKRTSEKGVIDYLNKFDINNNDKKNIINKLKEINLINDKDYCRAYINDKILLTKEGINKIKNNLLKENININIIEEELSNIDENIIDEKLEKIILKKIKSNKKYSNNYLKQKIINDMVLLGYDKVKIIDILDNNMIDDLNILENEFNKFYIKYKDKNIVKQKLLLKGFNIEDINNLMQKKEI